jgi:hypothetical protein
VEEQIAAELKVAGQLGDRCTDCEQALASKT